MKSKWVKRVMSLALTVTLAMSMMACGQGGTGEAGNLGGAGNQGGTTGTGDVADSGVGGWVENDLTPADVNNIYCAPIKMDDGSLCFFGSKGSDEDPELVKYTSADKGKTWTEEPMDWQEKTGGYISNISMIPNGNCIFVSYSINKETEQLEKMAIWYSKAGELTEVNALEGVNPYTLELLNENLVFVAGMDEKANKAYNKIVDLTTGQEISDNPSMSKNSYGMLMGTAVDRSDANAPRLYYVDYFEDKQKLCACESTGNLKEQLADITAEGAKGATDPDGNYYFVHGGGICRIVKDGTVQEQIMDDDGFQLGISNNYCMDLTYADAKDFFAVLFVNNGLKLYEYVWDANAVKTITDTITVWSLYENATVQAAVVAYEKAHPEIDIKYEVGMEDPEADAEDVIRSLNTRVVSGEGPDVLVLDGLDYENYINKGYLADFADAIDFEPLMDNITKPFVNEDGTCYMLPARFSAPVLMGDAGELDSLKTLDDFKKAILALQSRPNVQCDADSYYEDYTKEQRYGIGVVDMYELADLALRTSAPEVFKDGQLNHDNLTAVMDFMGSVAKYYSMDKYPEHGLVNGVYSSSDDFDPVGLSDGGYEYNVTKHAEFGWGDVETPAFFAECKRDRQAEDLKGDVLYQPGLCENVFKPMAILSVTASSKNQELAKLFIASVFDEEIQNVCYADGNAVRTTSLEANVEKHKDYVKNGGYDGDMMAFYNSLKTPVILSGNIALIEQYMITHAKAMAAGTETLDQAVAGVESDTKLMLQEQN